MLEDEYIRAAPGLTGFCKCGGNYAASIGRAPWPRKKALHRCLAGRGGEKCVEEVGSMNIMFKIGGKVYTAACTGTVLPA